MAGNSSGLSGPPVNFRNTDFSSSDFNSASPIYNRNSMLTTPVGRVFSAPAPPIPPRPVRNSYNSSYSPYNNYSYGGYSSPFGGYGGGFSYGGYGGYGYRPGFGSYSTSYPENRFIQLAEESSRPAFQSIQSILHAFSSVTMMFESSFNAIYSSYMSVLGVADNFAKLRNTFGQIFSTFAVIRTLNWIYKKILYSLGISKENVVQESLWSNTWKEISSLDSTENRQSKTNTLPFLIFMSVMIGGPYLLFKLLSSLQIHPSNEVWVPAEHPGSLAIGLYDFYAASDQELSITAQQKLMIAPKKFQPTDCPGWLLACNESRKIGLVPNNHIGVLMQSEKTGQTYIEHNGQRYLHSRNLSNSTDIKDSASKLEKTSQIGNSINNEDVIK